MWYHDPHRRRALPGRRHLVADRDRRHHDLAASRGHHHASRARPPSRCRASGPRSSTTPAQPVERGRRLPHPHPAVARRCCAASTATPSATSETYWSRFAGRYFAGDGAKIDDDGYFWLLGRVDDVMNVSGHRISTTEVESALVDHPAVAEAAVVGAKDDTTGQAIIAFVTLQGRVGRDRRAGRGAPRPRGPQDRAHRPAQDGRSSPTSCPRPAAARSCAGCCATWPRAATSATPPRWPTPRWSTRSGACRRPAAEDRPSRPSEA